MIQRIIDWSLTNRTLILLGALVITAWGIYAAQNMVLDAIPDLSDTQVIVKTSFPGQAPQLVEDQVTYPLASALLSVPGSSAVRGFSMFGESYIYVIFADGTDPYWARNRVIENLSQLTSRLPPGVSPTLGPDASGVGWVFQYVLVDRENRYDAGELRAIQDYFLKYELQSLPGVAEVASVGGMVRQFQIEVDPDLLDRYNLSLDQISQSVRDSNLSGGGSTVEMGRAEYMITSRGYLSTLDEFRDLPIGLSDQSVPIRLQDVANIQTGPEPRRGVADLDGEGDVTGGIVIMRYGHNALDTIAQVKKRLQTLQSGLPPGIELVVTYDRSGLITRAVDNLTWKLIEESVVVALVCLIFLFHVRSSLVAVITLPIGILAAFIIMKQQGVSANIMSLGGIAIAIGAMVDAAIVMIENMHKHLERAGDDPDYWAVARSSASEVGPALFFSLLIITVSFLPVFTLTGQEGKLFSPLAYTKSYSMAASAILAITLTPVLMGYFIRGYIPTENQNPINRVLQNWYRPALQVSLQNTKMTVFVAALISSSVLWPISQTGSEFMPSLYEGDLLYMPTTLPGISIGEARNILQITDRLIRQMPEVERVFGKAGRADTATDPAPLSMLETTILLKPRSEWPDGGSIDDLIKKLDRAVRIPGLTNSWGYPIRTRIDMLSTGIRTAVGIKISGPDLNGIATLARKMEKTLKTVPGTRTVFGERVAGGRYLDIDIKRTQAARYGLKVADIQRFVQSAIGGENIGTVIKGRERYSINLRYPRAFRDSLKSISASRITLPNGTQIPLGTVAKLSIIDGPAEIKSENGRLIGYIYIDIESHDLGGYVKAAKRALEDRVTIPPGFAYDWAGQYVNMMHAESRLYWAIAITVLTVLLLLYLHFRRLSHVVLVAMCMPFSLIGGFWLIYLLGYNLSVAVAVGFIALAGVAAEFGVVMLLYLDNAVAEFRRDGRLIDRGSLRAAIVQGALLRVRPKLMTVAVIIAGLLPVMVSDGTGSDVMKRIAAPLLGGMVTAPLLSLLIIPAFYELWFGKNSFISTQEDGLAIKSPDAQVGTIN